MSWLWMSLLTAALTALAYCIYRWGHLAFYLYDFLVVRFTMINAARRNTSVRDLFRSRVSRTPHRPFIVFDGNTLTYDQVDRQSNRIAFLFSGDTQHNIPLQATVALMMENSADFVILWLALCKSGITVALINTQLRGDALLHSIVVCDSVAIIVGHECITAIDSIKAHLPSSIPIYAHCAADQRPPESYIDLYSEINMISVNHEHYTQYTVTRPLSSKSLLFYIFTSGTTGLPKAAKIRHVRFILGGVSFATFFHLRDNDRIYVSLPLYHAVGGVLGVSMCWRVGGSIVIRHKFSARAFFSDCAQYKCTVVLYIGQLARYLMSTPPSPHDRKHMVRTAIGNGLPADIWADFQQRFNIEQIGEFYASTEGNANLVNNRNKVGAIGYIPWIASLIYPIRIVKFDMIEERPIRDVHGRCIDTTTNEVGELIGKITLNDPLRSFDGYTNTEATNDKILHSAFVKGDSWFRTGDLVRMDEDGYIFFVDRVGDTFRWKGENVSTTEVANFVTAFTGIAECNVYGVRVAGQDGRAGMCSLVLHNKSAADTAEHSNGHGRNGGDTHNRDGDMSHSTFDWASFYAHCAVTMPQYMRPLFVRVQPAIAITSTFKHRKVEMVKEGFDPRIINDPIYFRDDVALTYTPVNDELYHRINCGLVRI